MTSPGPLFNEKRRKLAPAYRPPTPKEGELHRDVAKLLDAYAKPDWRHSHFPAGEKRDLITGARLKKMGLKRGWPDFILVSPEGLFHALELKRAGEDLTDDQDALKSWCDDHGIPHAVAFDLTGVLDALSSWGALRLSINSRGVPALGEGA